MKQGSGPTYYLSHHRRQNNRKPQHSIAAAFRCGTGNTNQASRIETNLQTVSYLWLYVPSTCFDYIDVCIDWSSNLESESGGLGEYNLMRCSAEAHSTLALIEASETIRKRPIQTVAL